MVLCFCIIGAQLPTWMFINSLSLIVHTTLLNSLMPPSVFYTFKKYLNLVRLNWPQLNEDIENNIDVFDFENEKGLYSIYLRDSDYSHLFARNTVIIITAALIIFMTWATLAIIDQCTGNKKNPKKSSSNKRHCPCSISIGGKKYNIDVVSG